MLYLTCCFLSRALVPAHLGILWCACGAGAQVFLPPIVLPVGLGLLVFSFVRFSHRGFSKLILTLMIAGPTLSCRLVVCLRKLVGLKRVRSFCSECTALMFVRLCNEDKKWWSGDLAASTAQAGYRQDWTSVCSSLLSLWSPKARHQDIDSRWRRYWADPLAW